VFQQRVVHIAVYEMNKTLIEVSANHGGKRGAANVSDVNPSSEQNIRVHVWNTSFSLLPTTVSIP